MNIKKILERKIKGTLIRWFGIQFQSGSETSKVRNWVLPYCTGKGCDIGFGGDKIVKIDCDGIDFPVPYTKTGKDKVDIGCDVINNDIPVLNDTYDYVYTSHLIEDFVDTKDALRKFIRILKSGGNLVLVFPDQPKYEIYCKKLEIPMNPYHIHSNMGFDYMIKMLQEIEGIQFEIKFTSNCEVDYNVVIVAEITKER
jgi:ubiquinone/menaquinone biosynthesis C-methylase UbiE